MNLAPTTELAKRVAALCKRKPTTPWSPKEVSVYRRLVKSGFYDNLDDLALVEQYYAFERKKGDHGPNRGLHRRDLQTYLNNAAAELDRATAWREAHPIVKPPRKIIPNELPSPPPEPLSPEEEERRELFLAEMRRRNPESKAFQPRSDFAKIREEMGR